MCSLGHFSNRLDVGGKAQGHTHTTHTMHTLHTQHTEDSRTGGDQLTLKECSGISTCPLWGTVGRLTRPTLPILHTHLTSCISPFPLPHYLSTLKTTQKCYFRCFNFLFLFIYLYLFEYMHVCVSTFVHRSQRGHPVSSSIVFCLFL